MSCTHPCTLLIIMLGFIYQVDYTDGIFKRYEKDLLQHLLTNYSTSYRPAESNKESVKIWFDFKVEKIVEIDMKHQEILIHSIITKRWRDPQLAWDRNKWNDTRQLSVDNSLIWTPDIMLYNTAADKSQAPDDVYKGLASVSYKGEVLWISRVPLKASCDIDIKWFPFDTQICNLTFGSMSHPKSQLEVKPVSETNGTSDIESSTQYSSGDWRMKKVKLTSYEKKCSKCKDPFTLLNYTLVLERMYMYYMIYLIFPCVCIIFVSPFMFQIPADSGERAGFGVTIVLALSVYLLVISDKLPEKSDEAPLLGTLYTVMFILLVIALVVGIITTHLSYKITPPPNWLFNSLLKHDMEVKGSITINEGTFDESVENEETTMPAQHRPSLNKTLSSSHYQQQWKDIAFKLDKIFFYLFLALDLITPAIVSIIFAATD